MSLRPDSQRERVTAGKRDRRVTLQRFTSSTDPGSGEVIETWGTLALVWASRRDVSDSERLASAEVAAEIGTRWVIRWSSLWSDLSPLDRLESEGRIYEIVAVKELGTREGIEISTLARAEPAP